MISEIIIPSRKKAGELEGMVGKMVDCCGVSCCRIIYTGSDGSASVNRNLGLSKLVGEVAVMVDDDVDFMPVSECWLLNMLASLLDPEVVMVSAQLYKPDGSFAYMTGLDDCGLQPKSSGETVVPSKRLLTACCAFKHFGLRFDEEFIGSGFEDVDFCNQLSLLKPKGEFVVCHDAKVVHKNEQKNQLGKFWQLNKAHYEKKWGKS